MPIPAGVARISLTGTLPDGETFDTSFWTVGGAGSLDDLQAITDEVASYFVVANMGETIGALSAAGSYDFARGYGYPDGGPTAKWVTESALDADGQGTAQTLPLQTCWVVSLRTVQAGRSARGRMYLPATAVLLGADHQAQAGNTQTLADQWAAFFDDINSLQLPGGGNPAVSVVSQTLTSSLVVSHVIVDSRMDIQRRRANKQQPSTVASADLA